MPCRRAVTFAESAVVDLEEILHPPFRIVYRLDEYRIRIIRIWRGERLLRLPEAKR